MANEFERKVLEDLGKIKSDIAYLSGHINKLDTTLAAHSDSHGAHGSAAYERAYSRTKDFVTIGISIVALSTSLYMARLYAAMAPQSNGNINASRPAQ